MGKVINLFKGRIGRVDYFFYTYGLASLLLALFSIFTLLLGSSLNSSPFTYALAIPIGGISLILISGLSVRRCHDIGRSGWWILISLIPLVGLFSYSLFYFGLVILKTTNLENLNLLATIVSKLFLPSVFILHFFISPST